MVAFSDLPFELRTKIFRFTLPGPRVLHIIRPEKHGPAPEPSSPFTVSAASYGGKHPSILSVNRESRTEALKHLIKHLGVYWNFEIDFPYFEIHELSDKRAMFMTEMFRAGLLAPFHNIAMDSMVWGWPESTRSQEFRLMHGRDFIGILSPIQIKNQMPHLKQCVVTYTLHTLQNDLITPYQPWKFGPLTEEVTLCLDWEVRIKSWCVTEPIEERAYLNTDAGHATLNSALLQAWKGVEVTVMGIHGREREYFPPEKALRPPPLPQNYYDWFG